MSISPCKEEAPREGDEDLCDRNDDRVSSILVDMELQVRFLLMVLCPLTVSNPSPRQNIGSRTNVGCNQIYHFFIEFIKFKSKLTK